ncbi:MAG: hypothetical protein KGZ86_05145 [Candidatus Latescibacteria bacterium]|nr:hypothetical protein [Candidatus Latescibacterota bacterium]
MTTTEHQQLRRKALKMLYTARAKDPETGWVYGREFTEALGNCEFALAVLVEIGQVKREGHQYRITGPGVVAFEQEDGQ